MSDEEYNKKLESLQKYIPFLNNMISQLKDPNKKNREQQLSKMESLHSMITDKRKKLKLDTLIKCEDVIIKLFNKVHTTGQPPPDQASLHRSPRPPERNWSPSVSDRNRSPSFPGRNRSPSFPIRNRSPSIQDRSRSPSHSDRNRSPSHSDRNRSPSHSDRNRSPSISDRNRSPSYTDRYNNRSPRNDRFSKPVIVPSTVQSVSRRDEERPFVRRPAFEERGPGYRRQSPREYERRYETPASPSPERDGDWEEVPRREPPRYKPHVDLYKRAGESLLEGNRKDSVFNRLGYRPKLDISKPVLDANDLKELEVEDIKSMNLIQLSEVKEQIQRKLDETTRGVEKYKNVNTTVRNNTLPMKKPVPKSKTEMKKLEDIANKIAAPTLAQKAMKVETDRFDIPTRKELNKTDTSPLKNTKNATEVKNSAFNKTNIEKNTEMFPKKESPRKESTTVDKTDEEKQLDKKVPKSNEEKKQSPNEKVIKSNEEKQSLDKKLLPPNPAAKKDKLTTVNKSNDEKQSSDKKVPPAAAAAKKANSPRGERIVNVTDNLFGNLLSSLDSKIIEIKKKEKNERRTSVSSDKSKDDKKPKGDKKPSDGKTKPDENTSDTNTSVNSSIAEEKKEHKKKSKHRSKDKDKTEKSKNEETKNDKSVKKDKSDKTDKVEKRHDKSKKEETNVKTHKDKSHHKDDKKSSSSKHGEKSKGSEHKKSKSSSDGKSKDDSKKSSGSKDKSKHTDKTDKGKPKTNNETTSSEKTNKDTWSDDSEDIIEIKDLPAAEGKTQTDTIKDGQTLFKRLADKYCPKPRKAPVEGSIDIAKTIEKNMQIQQPKPLIPFNSIEKNIKAPQPKPLIPFLNEVTCKLPTPFSNLMSPQVSSQTLNSIISNPENSTIINNVVNVVNQISNNNARTNLLGSGNPPNFSKEVACKPPQALIPLNQELNLVKRPVNIPLLPTPNIDITSPDTRNNFNMPMQYNNRDRFMQKQIPQNQMTPGHIMSPTPPKVFNPFDVPVDPPVVQNQTFVTNTYNFNQPNAYQAGNVTPNINTMGNRAANMGNRGVGYNNMNNVTPNMTPSISPNLGNMTPDMGNMTPIHNMTSNMGNMNSNMGNMTPNPYSNQNFNNGYERNQFGPDNQNFGANYYAPREEFNQRRAIEEPEAPRFDYHRNQTKDPRLLRDPRNRDFRETSVEPNNDMSRNQMDFIPPNARNFRGDPRERNFRDPRERDFRADPREREFNFIAANERDTRGDPLERDFRGNTVERDFRGDTVERDFRGNTVDRDFRGDTVERDFRGDNRDRDLRGQDFDRDFRGHREPRDDFIIDRRGPPVTDDFTRDYDFTEYNRENDNRPGRYIPKPKDTRDRDVGRGFNRENRDSRDRNRYGDRERSRSRRRSRSRTRHVEEVFTSPLDSLYHTTETVAKTGKGYGFQNYKIKMEREYDHEKYKKKKKDGFEEDVKKSDHDTKEVPQSRVEDHSEGEEKDSEKTEIVESESKGKVDLEEPKTDLGKEKEEIQEPVKTGTEETVEVCANTDFSDSPIGRMKSKVIPLMESDTDNEEKTETCETKQEENEVEAAVPGTSKEENKPKEGTGTGTGTGTEEQRILAQFFKNLLSSSNKEDHKGALLSLITTFSDSFNDHKLKRITNILKSDDDSEKEASANEEEAETKANDSKEKPKDKNDEVVMHDVEVVLKKEDLEEKAGKRKRRVNLASETTTDEEETPVLVSVGERTKNRKRVPVKSTSGQGRSHKKKSELDKLHEDIQDMFIRDGVLTATGKRMCNMLQSDPSVLQSGTKSKGKNTGGDMKVPLFLPRVSVRLKRMSLDFLTKNVEDESSRYPLRKSARKDNYNESDNSFDTPKEEAIIEDVQPKKEQTEVTNKTNKLINRKRKFKSSWASGVIKKKKIKKSQSQDKGDSDDADDEQPMESSSEIVENEDEDSPKKVTKKAKKIAARNKKQKQDDVVYIEPDVNYYYGCSDMISCKLCPYEAGFLTSHYKVTHPDHEILISRLKPEKAEKAIELSKEKKLDELVEGENRGIKRMNYCCIFCSLIKKNSKPMFFHDHLTVHTGEYRFHCDLCSYSTPNRKMLPKHREEHNVPNTVGRRTRCQTFPQTIYGYICTVCNYVQLDRSNVENHTKIYHLGKGDKICRINMSTFTEEEAAMTDMTDSYVSDFDRLLTSEIEEFSKDDEFEDDSAPSTPKSKGSSPIKNRYSRSPVKKKVKLTRQKRQKPKPKCKQVKKNPPRKAASRVRAEEEENSAVTETSKDSDIITTETIREPEPEPEKQVELNVFTTDTDIFEEEKKIEEERLRTMEEVNKSVKITRNSLTFTESLSNRLNTEEEIEVKREHVEEPDPIPPIEDPIPPVQTFDKNKPDTQNVSPITSHVMKDFALPMKNNHIMDRMVEKLRGIISEPPPSDNVSSDSLSETYPPLIDIDQNLFTPVSDCVTLKTGLITIVKRLEEVSYCCLVPSCAWITHDQEMFANHCTVAHEWVSYTLSKCEACGCKVKSHNVSPLLTDLLEHIKKDHADFIQVEKKPVLRPRRLSGDKLSTVKEVEINTGEDSNNDERIEVITEVEESAGEMIETTDEPQEEQDPLAQNQDNPFGIKIGEVVSLADSNNVPKLLPFSKKPSPVKAVIKPLKPVHGQVVSLKEIDMNALEISRPRKSVAAASVLLQLPRNLYKCPEFFCKFSTNSRELYDRHVTTHEAVGIAKLYPCIYCDVKTPLEDSGLHIDVRHRDCSFACVHCFYRAMKKEFVAMHMEEEHPQAKWCVVVIPKGNAPKKAYLPASENKKEIKDLVLPYICFCGRSFLFLNEFKVHIANCILPPVCRYPNCSNRHVDDLLKHIETVHNIRPYQCGLCSFSGQTARDVLKHHIWKHPSQEEKVVARHEPILPGEYFFKIAGLKQLHHIPIEQFGYSNIEVKAQPISLLKRKIGAAIVKAVLPESTNVNIIKQIPLHINPPVNAVIVNTQNCKKTILPKTPESNPTTSKKDDGKPRILNFDLNLSLFKNPLLDHAEKDRMSASAANEPVFNPVEFIAEDEESVSSLLSSFENQTDPLEVTAEEASTIIAEPPVLSFQPVIIPKTPTRELINNTAASSPASDVSSTARLPEKSPSDKLKKVQRSVSMSGEDSDSTDCDSLPKARGLVGSELYRCALCEQTFNNMVLFKDHVMVSTLCRSSNSTMKPYMCAHCGKYFRHPNGLFLHVQYHGLERYICSLCNEKFTHHMPCKTHMKYRHNIHSTHSVPVDPNNTDPDDGQFIVKPRSQKPASPPPPVAPKDPTRLQDTYMPSELAQLPIRSIFGREVRCGVCSYGTKVRTNLVRHLQMHGAEKDVPDQAPVNPVPCLDRNEKMFDKMTNLAISSQGGGRMGGMKTTEKAPTTSSAAPQTESPYPRYVPPHRRYVCGSPDCSYLCLEESMLRRHLSTLHTEETGFRCPHCRHQLGDTEDTDALLKHLKLHDLCLYRCNKCDYLHSLQHKVRRHCDEDGGEVVVVRSGDAATIEGEAGERAPAGEVGEAENRETMQAPAKQTKAWRCLMCRYRTATEFEISQHVTHKHDMDHRYKCTVCPYRSQEIRAIQEHHQVEHAGQPMDIIEAYKYVVDEEKEDFDTTPLWTRDKLRVRHIRGILLDESSSSGGGGKVRGKEKGSSVKVVREKEMSNLDDTIDAVAKGKSGTSKNVEYKAPSPQPSTSYAIDTKITPSITNDVESNRSNAVITLSDSDEDDSNLLIVSASHAISKPLVSNAPSPDVIPMEVDEFVDVMNVEEVPCEESGGLTVEGLKKKFGDFGQPRDLQLICPKCSKFKTRKLVDFVHHVFRDLDYKRFECLVCHIRSVTKRFVLTHIQNHPGGDETSLRVMPIERDIVHWVEAVVRHQARIIANGRPIPVPLQNSSSRQMFVCQFCQDRFVSPADCQVHELRHWMTPSLHCSTCEFKCDIVEEMAAHQAAKHYPVELPVSYRPGMSISLQQYLDASTERVDHRFCLPKIDTFPRQLEKPAGDDIISLYCGKCSKKEKSMNDLRTHFSNEHPGLNFTFKKKRGLENVMACGYCNERGIDSALKIHHATFHQNQPLKIYKYKCTLCEQVFRRLDYFRLHCRKFHNRAKLDFLNVFGDIESEDLFGYACPICLHVSPTPNAFRSHLRVHIKIFRCRLCNQQLKSRTDSQNHFARDHPHHPNSVEVLRDKIKEYEDICFQVLGTRPHIRYDEYANEETIYMTTRVDQDTDDSLLISTPSVPVSKTVARKSTSGPSKPEQFSFYGVPQEKINLAGIITSVEVNKTEVAMDVEKLSAIVNLSPRVMVKDCAPLLQGRHTVIINDNMITLPDDSPMEESASGISPLMEEADSDVLVIDLDS